MLIRQYLRHNIISDVYDSLHMDCSYDCYLLLLCVLNIHIFDEYDFITHINE